MATLLEQAEVGPEPTSAVVGRNPWALAGRRLRRNRIALAALALFLLIVVLSLAAPLYAKYVAHVNPFPPNLNGHTVVNGKVVVREGRLATLDLPPVIERHNALAHALVEASR